MRILQNVFLAVVIGGLATNLCLGAEAVATLAPPPGPVNKPDTGKRFDVDFKGGPPKALVEAVEKAAKEPVNVIIPEEHKDFVLPPLRVRNVTVPELFSALTAASHKTETRYQGNSFQRVTVAHGFRTYDRSAHPGAIWYFYVEDPGGTPTPPQPAPQCRFWNLEPYLEKLKVEDITTAVETGWKMLGVNPLPKLTFHKDTQLLVVVGQLDQLKLVDDVLRELSVDSPSIDPATGLPVPKPTKRAGERAQNLGEKPSKR